MNFIRLKTAINDIAIEDRLKYHPEIVEFHLVESDLEDIERLKKYIRYIKQHDSKVYLHHPMTYKGEKLDIISNNPEVREYYDQSTKLLARLCKEENIYCVIHAHYNKTYSSIITEEKVKHVIERIRYILTFDGSEHLLWENTIEGVFSYQNPNLIEQIVKPLNLPLTFDVSHAFISLRGNNEKLEDVLKKSISYIRYAHVVDSMGEIHDSLPLGQGKTNWVKVKPYLVNLDFIFEINTSSSNHMDCTPMVESGLYFSKI
jgi:sugar phosphate isomerase/epimerase